MHFKKIKVIATLGPSSDSPKTIQKFAQEGVDIFRINLSHARHEDVARILKDIRTIEKDDNFVIAAGMPFGQIGSTNMILVEKL